MNTLRCTLQPFLLHTSRASPWTPKITSLFPTIATLKQKPPLSTIRPLASAKGFGAPSTSKDDSSKDFDTNKNEEKEEEIPQAVFERMFVRILFAVGVPMGLGFACLYIYGSIMDQKLFDVPLWVPFMTSLILFGASSLGIAYGALSTSWDVNNRGSFLGWEEVQKNWLEMWDEDKQTSA